VETIWYCTIKLTIIVLFLLIVNTGAIAGIVIGVVIFVLLVVALLIVCWIRVHRSVISILLYTPELIAWFL